MMGGSAERARAHYDRAIALSGGLRASPYVTWARSSAVARQARREYRETLEKALAIDPDASPPDRLLNLVSQRRARTLLERIDDFFFTDEIDEAGIERIMKDRVPGVTEVRQPGDELVETGTTVTL